MSALTAFQWLAGKANTGTKTTLDRRTDQYRAGLDKLPVPKFFTPTNVAQMTQRAALAEKQAELGKQWFEGANIYIKSMNALDETQSKSAVVYAKTAREISDRRVASADVLMDAAANVQINDARLNGLQAAYREALRGS